MKGVRGYGKLDLHFKDCFQLLEFGFAFFNFCIIVLPELNQQLSGDV